MTLIDNSEYSIRLSKANKLTEQSEKGWQTQKNITCDSEKAKIISLDDYSKSYSFAGRITAKREHGKSIFLLIEDSKGSIQAYIKQEDSLIKSFDYINSFLDLGDYVYIEGSLFKTKTDELTIRISNIQLLSKCLHPLPDLYHGFENLETKYRRRYLDLMVNKKTKERFIKRSLIIKYIRSFLDSHDFIEVETPMLHSIPGGAAAKPFITHHNALDMELFLRIAPELYLKRLVVGGLERVYEINRNFRNEGISTRHNPEFTMLEFYIAHLNYNQGMDLVEKLIKEVIFRVNSTLMVTYNEQILDFEKPFDRISPKEAILKYSDLKETDLAESHIDETLKKSNLNSFLKKSYHEKVFALFEAYAEKKLINPTFIIKFPIEISPLAQKDSTDEKIAARYELFIAGMEISNGFNELTDPFDQSDRFKKQVELRGEGDEEAMYYDKDYIEALEYGLPPTFGSGIGIDRLVMLATNTNTIKEVILFPLLKIKTDE